MAYAQGVHVGVAALICLSTLPLQCRAQTASAGVDAAAVLAEDGRDNRLPVRMNGGGVGLTYQTAGRLSWSFELNWFQTRAYDTTSRLPHADGAATVTNAHRTFGSSNGDVLLGIRLTSTARVEVIARAGLGVERRAFDAAISQDVIDPSGATLQHLVVDTSGPPNRDEFTWPQIPFGLDAVIRVTDHFAVVPQLRAWWTPQLGDGCCTGFYTGLRLAARWTF